MPTYKIRDLRTEEAVKALLEAELGKRPKNVTFSVLVDVSEVEFDAPLTDVEVKQMYRTLSKLDKRMEWKVDKP